MSATNVEVATPPPPAPTPRVSQLEAAKATAPVEDEARGGIGANGGAREVALKRGAATQFEPEPIGKRPDVQFVFHVWPRGAEILVDDKKVEGNKLMLRFQTRPHRVLVRAPGYHTITTSAPSTANRTFELRMDRIVVRRSRSRSRRRPPGRRTTRHPFRTLMRSRRCVRCPRRIGRRRRRAS